jgi:2-deoxy-D-gluconate 3-dehydrogenase
MPFRVLRRAWHGRSSGRRNELAFVIEDLFSLKGRVALITGGNGGLGRAIALAYREAGAQVVVTGRSAEKNEAMRQALDDPAAVLSLDVYDEGAVERAIAGVQQRFGRFDILVNNAGQSRRGSVPDVSKADWEDILNVNLTGPFLCATHAARQMIASGHGGKIINISSMYAVYGPPNVASYAASKTGLLGLTRSLAVELSKHNIQVNAILPGWYLTEMTGHLKSMPLADYIRRKTPAGRWGNPQDLLGVAILLASGASDFMTGAAIPVDGGYSVADRLLYD